MKRKINTSMRESKLTYLASRWVSLPPFQLTALPERWRTIKISWLFINAFRLNAMAKVNVQFLRKVAEYFSSDDFEQFWNL